MPRVIVTTLTAAALACAVLTARAAGDDAVRFERLVEQLGDADYFTRTRATEALAEAGRAALPFLRRALDGTDLEARYRAQLIMERVQWMHGTAFRDRIGVDLAGYPGLPDNERRERIDRLIERGGGQAAPFLALIAHADPQPAQRNRAMQGLERIATREETAREALEYLSPHGPFYERLALAQCHLALKRSERGMELMAALFDDVNDDTQHLALARRWSDAARTDPLLWRHVRDARQAVEDAPARPPVRIDGDAPPNWPLRARLRALYMLALRAPDDELMAFVAPRWVTADPERRGDVINAATNMYQRAASTLRIETIDRLEDLLASLPAVRHEDLRLLYLRYLTGELRDRADPRLLAFIANQRPNDAEAHYAAGEFLRSLKRNDLAAEAYFVATGAQADPRQAVPAMRAMLRLARIYAEAGRGAMAAQFLIDARTAATRIEGRAAQTLLTELDRDTFACAEYLYRDRRIEELEKVMAAGRPEVQNTLPMMYLRYLAASVRGAQPPAEVSRALSEPEKLSARDSYEAGQFLERLREPALALAEYRRSVTLPGEGSPDRSARNQAQRRIEALERTQPR